MNYMSDYSIEHLRDRFPLQKRIPFPTLNVPWPKSKKNAAREMESSVERSQTNLPTENSLKNLDTSHPPIASSWEQKSATILDLNPLALFKTRTESIWTHLTLQIQKNGWKYPLKKLCSAHEPLFSLIKSEYWASLGIEQNYSDEVAWGGSLLWEHFFLWEGNSSIKIFKLKSNQQLLCSVCEGLF